MNKLQIVTDKICELLKGSELDPMELKEGNYIQGVPEVPIRVLLVDPNGFVHAAWRDGSRTWFKPNEVISVSAPIREAEVLMALGKYTGGRTEVALDHLGQFLYIDKYSEVECPHAGWKLGQPLSSQSESTIEFLYNVLNCEG